MLILSKNQLGKIADKVNNKPIEDENESGGTAFMSKKSKNAKFKNLTCA